VDGRERALALALLPKLLREERRTARTLLRAERHVLATLRQAVSRAIAPSVLLLARERLTRADAMVAVRRAGPELRAHVERAVLEGRAHARTAARGTLPDGTLPPPPVTDEDAAAAHASSSSYAAAWTTTAMLGVLTWADTGEGGSPVRALSPSAQDYRLRAIAATESARAFNDERIRAVRQSDARTPGVFKVWSAVLDRRTCTDCFGRDGETIPLVSSFGTTPPVHVNCRCTIGFVFVPHPERLDDIAFDYDLFKREMRDVVRERHVQSDRHAPGFMRASQGRTRSPVVLTRKFAGLAH
jgi:SPP1 gp7 family putative phage head morphogenesis protein